MLENESESDGVSVCSMFDVLAESSMESLGVTYLRLLKTDESGGA